MKKYLHCFVVAFALSGCESEQPKKGGSDAADSKVAYHKSEEPKKGSREAVDAKVAYHMGQIRSGDLDLKWQFEACEAGEWWYEPYHVWKLIVIGRPASRRLVELLRDTTPINLEYVGPTLKFLRGGILPAGDAVKRRATVADVANYALVRIHGTGVGFRSYLNLDKREKAIARWKRIIDARNGKGKEGTRQNGK